MYKPTELVRRRILNRTAPYSDEFFDSLVDVIYMGLKITLDLPATKVYELFFYDGEWTDVTLYDPITEKTFTAEISACTVWNEYENRAIGGLQSVIDVLEVLMPKGDS